MKGLPGTLVLVALLTLRATAFATPHDWAGAAIRALAADGVIDGVPAGTLSRPQMALLIARAMAKVEASGASKEDVARVQALGSAFRDELSVLGVREPDLAQARAALNERTAQARSFHITGEMSAGTDRAARASIVVAVPRSAHLQNLFVQAGTLQYMPSSVAGLAFSTRNSLQPLLRGWSVSGTANGLSDFYFSVARMDPDLSLAAPVAIGTPTDPSFLFGVTPQAGGYLQFRSRNLVAGRLVQRLRFAPGATIGLTYDHIFDAGRGASNDLVSSTVFGVDFSVPLRSRSGFQPALYAEAATSAVTSNVPALFTPAARYDSALVAGIKFALHAVSGSVQYQSVGANFTNGALSAGSFFGLNVPALAERPLSQPNSLVVAQNTGPASGSAYPAFNPFGDTAPGSLSAYVPNTQGVHVELSAPVRLGSSSVQGNFSAAHLQEISPEAFGSTSTTRGTQDRLLAGATFNVHALHRSVALNVSGSYEHLLRSDSTGTAYVPYSANSQGPDPGAFVTAPAGFNPVSFNPNIIDVTRRSLGAGAVVPLSSNLRLNVQYNAQYYTGSYSGAAQNIDGRNDFYLGNLTYNLPRTSSAITFSAKQYRYRDNLLPTTDLTQNRADLNFTVKF
ncbi:MAG: hypothetical protein NVS9B12_09650 [Vulcanimicrobiaceae bacterium]